MFGSSNDFGLAQVRGRKENRRVIDDVSFRVLDAGIGHFFRQIPRIGDDSLKRRGRHRFRGTEIDLVVFRPRAPGEVSRHSAKAHFPGARGLPHADAPRQPGFMDPRPGAMRSIMRPRFGPLHWPEPAGSRVHVQGGVRMAVPALQDLGHHHEIPKGRVHAAANDDLIDFDPGHLAHGNHISRRRRAGDEGFKGGKIDLIVLVIGGSFVGASSPRAARVPGLPGRPGCFRRKGKSAGRSQFGPHIADGFPIGSGKSFTPGPVILDDFPTHPLTP